MQKFRYRLHFINCRRDFILNMCMFYVTYVQWYNIFKNTIVMWNRNVNLHGKFCKNRSIFLWIWNSQIVDIRKIKFITISYLGYKMLNYSYFKNYNNDKCDKYFFCCQYLLSFLGHNEIDMICIKKKKHLQWYKYVKYSCRLSNSNSMCVEQPKWHWRVINKSKNDLKFFFHSWTLWNQHIFL